MIRGCMHIPISILRVDFEAIIQYQSLKLKEHPVPIVTTRWHHNGCETMNTNGGHMSGPVLRSLETDVIRIDNWADNLGSLVVADDLKLSASTPSWNGEVSFGRVQSKKSLHSLEWEINGDNFHLTWSIITPFGEIESSEATFPISHDTNEMESRILAHLGVHWIAENIYPQPVTHEFAEEQESPLIKSMVFAGNWLGNKRISFDISIQERLIWTQNGSPEYTEDMTQIECINSFEMQSGETVVRSQGIPHIYSTFEDAENAVEQFNRIATDQFNQGMSGLFFIELFPEYERQISIQSPPFRDPQKPPVDFYFRIDGWEMRPRIFIPRAELVKNELSFEKLLNVKIDDTAGLKIQYEARLRNSYTTQTRSVLTKYYDIGEWIDTYIFSTNGWNEIFGNEGEGGIINSRFVEVLQYRFGKQHSYHDWAAMLGGDSPLRPIDIGKSIRGTRLQEEGFEFAIDPFTLRVFSRRKQISPWVMPNYSDLSTSIDVLEAELEAGVSDLEDGLRMHLLERWMIEAQPQLERI